MTESLSRLENGEFLKIGMLKFVSYKYKALSTGFEICITSCGQDCTWLLSNYETRKTARGASNGV